MSIQDSFDSADIFICDQDDPHTAFIIGECKKPKRSEGLEQLKSTVVNKKACLGQETGLRLEN
jgi:hypothetical protein